MLEKAELYKILQDDEDFKNYLASDKWLFEELDKRDKDFEEGKIKLTTRAQLTARLNNRRNVV